MLLSGLLFESTDGGSRFWLTTEREIIVGRNPAAWGWPNIRVASQMVSRQHARIGAHEGRYWLEDAGSSGGMYLDGDHVRGRVPIGPGMRLQLSSDVVYEIRSLRAQSLWDVLRDKPMPPSLALRMAEQILRTLLPLHESDRCHGDLTPYEILCAEHASFVLLLRGWAEVGPDAIRGNPVYTAPETISEARIEPATDIYVLGLILFEALAGERPYSTDTPLTNIASKLAGPPTTWPPSWPPARRAWLTSALTVDPRKRPTAREALDRLPGPRS